MKIDLCKLFGVEENELFGLKFKNYKPMKRKIHNNVLLELEFDEDWVAANDLPIQDLAEEFELIKLKQFSQDTLNFFKMIDKKYEWIAKDKNESVTVFQNKPTKNSRYWEIENEFEETRSLSAINQSLFDKILWEDEEPIRIDDYVER